MRVGAWLVGGAWLLVGCGDPPMGADASSGDGEVSAPCVTDEDCDARFCLVEVCRPGAASADRRGCALGDPPLTPCTTGQQCDEAARACRTICAETLDADGDGVVAAECGGEDCDDSDPRRFPGNAELCDAAGHDEDCDPRTFGELDADVDGHVSARCRNVIDGVVTSAGDDCNDAMPEIHPGADEVCNLRDDDCDGSVDEGVMVAGFDDLDGDGDGAPGSPRMACPGTGRFSLTGTDCDDTSIFVRGGLFELCDGIDNDCDGTVDESPRAVAWYPDVDGDLFGDAAGRVVVSCTPVAGHSILGTDCDDGARGVHPAQAEQCNGIDDDCNGLADYVIAPGDLEDDDLDGVADAACPLGTDCADDDRFVAGDAPELCGNRVDDDCDGTIDEEAPPVAWYPDLDLDGFGDAAGAVVMDCHRVAGYSFRAGDCDDSDARVRPTAPDRCGGGDENCDGRRDEHARDRRVVFPDRDGDGVGVEAGASLVCGPTPFGFGETPRDCAPDDPARSILYPDRDGDGVGDLGAEPVAMCSATSGLAPTALDCDDADPRVTTADACVDPCNGLDDDHDGRVDEDGAMGCPNASTTRWRCEMGRCLFDGCVAGVGGDCNGVAADGCEVDTTSDSLRCGSCTTSCDVGEACRMGVCDDPIVDVQCGFASTMALRRSGAVVWWGSSGISGSYTAGIVPTSSAVSVFLPRISRAEDAMRLEHRWRRGCVVTHGGERLCWGGSDGCGGAGAAVLGTGSTASVAIPSPLAVSDPADVAFGTCMACAARAGGSVACWGYGGTSSATGPGLGDGSGAASSAPVTVVGLSDARDVEAGAGYVCALRASGRVLCWGENGTGQLGDGTTIDRSFPVREVELASTSLPLAGATAIATTSYNPGAAGTGSACALLTDRTAVCWGSNLHGQLGADLVTGGAGLGAHSTRAVPVVAAAGSTAPLAGIAALHGGGQTFYAVHMDGRVSAWGRNASGQLGVGGTALRAAPVPVSLPAPVARFSAGESHACALLTDGRVFCWGENEDYQAGGESTADFLTPREVTSLYRRP